MTPDEYAAKRRAYDRARYVAQRAERITKARDRYQTNPQHRAEKRSYARGYQAGMRKAAAVSSATRARYTNNPEQ